MTQAWLNTVVCGSIFGLAKNPLQSFLSILPHLTVNVTSYCHAGEISFLGMAVGRTLDFISNPLASSEQLYNLGRRDTESAQLVRFLQAQLTQAAGVLLQLPQETIAKAIVILQRFILTNPTQEFKPRIYSASAIYLSAKISFTPLSPRSVVNVYAYLSSSASPLWSINPNGPPLDPDPLVYFVSEGTYERERQQIYICESLILKEIKFDTRDMLPNTLALTYLQILGASSTTLARRVFEHLSGGLLSPQMLYVTHQPNALACGAIYLAAREVGVKLVEENWWEVFDVDREDLGFLVLAFGSVSNFAEAQKRKLEESPMTLD